VFAVIALVDPEMHRAAVALLVPPCFAAVIASAARADLIGGRSVLRQSALVRLGVWSYAL